MASSILWYSAKLSYTYTTEQTVRVSVDGVPFDVTCVVEGVGTNLFGYRVYMNKRLRIPLSELRTHPAPEEGQEGKLVIDPQSLQDALAPRLRDLQHLPAKNVPATHQPQAK